MQWNCYTINTSRVIYEVLNTEAIIINFNTGDYYALPHIAKHVWQLLEKNLSIPDIAQLLALYYHKDESKVLADLQNFLHQLADESLIIPNENQSNETCANVEDVIGIECRNWEYDIPTMQKYIDVQNLLLLDPIHDVNDTGWPNTPK